MKKQTKHPTPSTYTSKNLRENTRLARQISFDFVKNFRRCTWHPSGAPADVDRYAKKTPRMCVVRLPKLVEILRVLSEIHVAPTRDAPTALSLDLSPSETPSARWRQGWWTKIGWRGTSRVGPALPVGNAEREREARVVSKNRVARYLARGSHSPRRKRRARDRGKGGGQNRVARFLARGSRSPRRKPREDV